MTDRNSGFKKDETKNTDNGFVGDGCHNCCHNPKFVSMRKKVGKPKVDSEVFDHQMEVLSDAYSMEVEEGTHGVYWDHLAYTFMNDEEFKDTIYSCIDAYTEFPTIADILEMGMRLKMLKEGD